MKVEIHAGEVGKAWKTGLYVNLCFQKLTGLPILNKAQEIKRLPKPSKRKFSLDYRIFLIFLPLFFAPMSYSEGLRWVFTGVINRLSTRSKSY